MHQIYQKAVRLVAFCCIFQLPLSVPAQASSLQLLNIGMFTALQAITAQNVCISYTYDHNGNVLVSTSGAQGTQAVWGTSRFGCFSWSP